MCTPGPDGKSPSKLMGRQFCGILPMTDKSDVNTDHFSHRKHTEKEIHDQRELQPLTIGSTVAYLNADLNTLGPA